MTRFQTMARTARSGAQSIAVFALCAAATMVLPLTLAAMGV